MNLLSTTEKARIFKKSENIALLQILNVLQERYEKRLTKKEQAFDAAIERMQDACFKALESIVEIKRGPVGVGIKGDKGDIGNSPTDAHLVKLIKPLIPKVRDGKTPSENQLRQLIKQVMPNVPDVTAVAALVLANLEKPQSVASIVRIVQAEIKKQENKEEKEYAITQVRGLSAALKALSQSVRTLKQRKGGGATGGGGGMGNWVPDDFVGDGVTTDFQLTYKVASNGYAAIVLLNGQTQEVNTHFNITTAGRVVFTTAPFNGAFIHVLYVRK